MYLFTERIDYTHTQTDFCYLQKICYKNDYAFEKFGQYGKTIQKSH